ncbi:hypothetical protein [Plantactinospora sp. KLBMP9567]|uniref:hypothetical protein n=1 Tax=Plantactinospora sp. KLBMP9567 TaxID=3085900 RepID=UPI0029826568|nr:hypothetical protein [Plantactinospora sp. KLBMP9567]MDW5324142.1 hypothetical protein [Plantactinospora sp. KLBMP9567]
MASPSAFLRVLVGVVVVAAAGGCEPGTPDAGATTSPATAGPPPSPVVVGRERPVKITGPQAGLLTQEQIEAAVPGMSGPGVSFTEQVLPELQEKTLDWFYYRDMSDEVRCDKLPEIWLAGKGSTGYSCQYLRIRTVSDTERRWADEEIFVRDDGE